MTAPIDVKALLDPEVAEALAAFPIDLGVLTPELLSTIRDAMGSMPQTVELSDRVSRVDHAVSADVSVRVHRPVGVEGALPAVYWIHGGGLVLGANTMADARFDRWCQELGCVGVAVEYRLAPEFPYPTPLEDCYEGLQWTIQHADELGIDTARLGIGGDSAGGGLAAGLALLARDRGGPSIAFQLLVYPMIDDRQITPSSQWADPVWPPSANTFGWTSYLGDRKGGPDVPVYAAAARATDLAGLPPTYIHVGALDGFSDEDIDYAVRLRHAGVPVELHVFPGGPHGFDSIVAGSAISKRANGQLEGWLRSVL